MQKHWATISKEIGLDKRILQHMATPGNRCRRIVAQEKVAGSSPVGHPPFCLTTMAAHQTSLLAALASPAGCCGELCSALNTQVLSGAVARRTGIIVGTGSLSRKSRTSWLTNEGFSMKWACDVPGTTASSEFGMARYSSTVCSRVTTS